MTVSDLTPQEASPPKKRKLTERLRGDWAACLCLTLAGFIARVPSLQGEPIWDDDYLVRTNALIKSPLLIIEVFRHYLFQGTYSAHYRPVQNLSYLFDYLFWNNNFYGFHLTNLLCHIGSGVLLYLLLQRLLPALQVKPIGPSPTPPAAFPHKLAAFFIALLWVVHPVHSAAVDYVSGRADSLTFLFACSSWLLFLKASQLTTLHARILVFSFAWFAGLLALCSRESGLIWTGIFLLYLFAFNPSLAPKTKWSTAICCAFMLGVYGGLRLLPGPPSLPDDPSDATPFLFRLVLMMRSLGDYGRLLLFPANLHMERTVYSPKAYQSEIGRWHAIEHEYLAVAGLLVLATLIILCFRTGRGQKLRIFGTAWFFLAYLPVSNLISLNATVAEHWLYLPSVGLLMFIVGCALELTVPLQRLAVGLACLAAIGFGIRSAYRSGDWTSNENFARQTIASGGGSMRIVLLLAQSYANRGDYAAAEHLLRRGLQLSPDYPMARNNLADALAHQNKEKEAESIFAHAAQTAAEDRKSHPRTWIAALNLSQLLYREHDRAGAIDVLEKARHNYPDTWELLGAESELLREGNDIEQALRLIRPFAEANWWHYRAWLGYGRLLTQKGDVEAAVAILRHASWLDIHETAALNLIAMMQFNENKLEDACRVQRRAVARQPDEPRQYILLSNILDKMGRNEEARAALAQVSRLRMLADSKTAAN
jgi:Flp pilus assembly protein TadD